MTVTAKPRNRRMVDPQTGHLDPVWEKWLDYLADMLETVNVDGAKKFGIKEDRLPGNLVTDTQLGEVVANNEQSLTGLTLDNITDGTNYKRVVSGSIDSSNRVKRVDVAHSGLSNGEYQGKVVTATIDSSQTVALGTLLCRASDGELEVFDATKAMQTSEIFMSLGTGTGSQSVLCSGSTVRNTSWSWTAGKTIWASPGTPGAITQTNPLGTSYQTSFPIGHAIDTDTIHFERATAPTTAAQEELFFSVLEYTEHWNKLVVHGSYLYAISGLGNKIYRSSDGNTWTDVSYTGMTAHTVNDAVSDGTYLYLAGTFTISGASKKGIVRSSDGVAYSLVLKLSDGYQCMSVYKGATYYFAGTDATGGNPHVYRSSDGESWSSVYSGSANVLAFKCFLEYDGDLYAGLEYTGSAAKLAYSSTDGATWNFIGGLCATDSDGTGFDFVRNNGSQLVTGGYYSGLWARVFNESLGYTEWTQVHTVGTLDGLFRTMSGTKRFYFYSYPEVYHTKDFLTFTVVDGPADKIYFVSFAEFNGDLYAASSQTGKYRIWRLSRSLNLTMTG